MSKFSNTPDSTGCWTFVLQASPGGSVVKNPPALALCCGFSFFITLLNHISLDSTHCPCDRTKFHLAIVTQSIHL